MHAINLYWKRIEQRNQVQKNFFSNTSLLVPWEILQHLARFAKDLNTDSIAGLSMFRNSTFYVVPNSNGYGDWSIIRSGGMKVADAQTQQTAVNNLRSSGSPGTQGDQVIVYGSRQNQIVNNFTLS